MPVTLTLKNIPDQLYERLRAAADAHRRSLNGEAIVCLESVLAPARLNAGERIARARSLRAGVSGPVPAADIDSAKRQGRS